MKTSRIFIAIICLLVPLAARLLYDNQGVYPSNRIIPTPEYINLTIPRPPLSTPLVEATSTTKEGAYIVFDAIHNNGFVFSEIEPLTRTLANQGARIVLNDGRQPLSEHLKRAQAYVIINPTLMSTPEEVSLISGFVQRGGRLLVITDPTRSYPGSYRPSYELPSSGGGGASATFFSTEVANYLLAPYNIAYQEDYVYNTLQNEGNFRNIIITNIGKNRLGDKLNKVVFYSAHSIKTTQSALLKGDQSTLSSINDQGGDLALAALAQSDRVLVLGDLTFMTQPYNSVADNQQLVINISHFLVSGAPIRELSDFPYLFKDNLTILVDKDTGLETRQLSSLSNFQKTYGAYGITINFATTPVKVSDLLVTGIFPPDKTIETYTKPFNLEFYGVKPHTTPTTRPTPTPFVLPTLPDTGGVAKSTPTPFFIQRATSVPTKADDKAGPSVNVPGFGKISTSGLGLILFSPAGERNVLILMADTKTNLTSLIDMVASGRLKNCTIQGNIAACSLSVSKGASDDQSGGGYKYEDEGVG